MTYATKRAIYNIYVYLHIANTVSRWKEARVHDLIII